MMDHVDAERRRLVEHFRSVSGGPGLSAAQRYILAAMIVAAAAAIEWLVFDVWLRRPPATFVGLIVAVSAASRFLGAGPGWFTAALATLDLAYDMSRYGNLEEERFLGTVAAYVTILLFRPGSFRGPARFLRSLPAQSPFRSRRTSSPIIRSVTASSIIGWPDASRSRSL